MEPGVFWAMEVGASVVKVRCSPTAEGSGWETFWEAELSGAWPMLTGPHEWFQNVAMALMQLQLKVTGYYSHQRA